MCGLKSSGGGVQLEGKYRLKLRHPLSPQTQIQGGPDSCPCGVVGILLEGDGGGQQHGSLQTSSEPRWNCAVTIDDHLTRRTANGQTHGYRVARKTAGLPDGGVLSWARCASEHGWSPGRASLLAFAYVSPGIVGCLSLLTTRPAYRSCPIAEHPTRRVVDPLSWVAVHTGSSSRSVR